MDGSTEPNAGASRRPIASPLPPSQARPPAKARAIRRGSGWGLVVVALLAAAIVHASRKALVSRLSAVHEKYDVYVLPPPSALPALSLGFRSALADLLMTSAIVQYGIHGQERRRFDDVGRLLDSVIELDPTFREPYRLADTFIIYHPVGEPTLDDVEHARRILEKGLRMRPDDGDLWLSAGEFMAFIAPSFLKDPKAIDEYRHAGATMLARAGELVHGDESVQWKALAAAGIFTKQGAREAAISSLERVYAVTDDDALRGEILRRLEALRAEKSFENAREQAEAFRAVWGKDLPFLSKTQMLVVGPPRSVWGCAGRGAGLSAARAGAALAGALRRADEARATTLAESCADSWLEWAEARKHAAGD